MPIPRKPEVMAGGAFRLLAEHQKAGDHRYEFRADGDYAALVVSGPLERQFRITLGPDGSGEWGVWKQGREMKRLGFCEIGVVSSS